MSRPYCLAAPTPAITASNASSNSATICRCDNPPLGAAIGLRGFGECADSPPLDPCDQCTHRSAIVGGCLGRASNTNPASWRACSAVFNEICAATPRSRSETVLRLTPSCVAKTVCDSRARLRPAALPPHALNLDDHRARRVSANNPHRSLHESTCSLEHQRARDIEQHPQSRRRTLHRNLAQAAGNYRALMEKGLTIKTDQTHVQLQDLQRATERCHENRSEARPYSTLSPVAVMGQVRARSTAGA